MGTTAEQRLAQAEATARRWFRILESLAGTSTDDEVFCQVHSSWVAAEQAVILQRNGALGPPASRRS